MSDLAAQLLHDAGIERMTDDKCFEPVAKYYKNMDFMLYLTEDCSYRADRVGQFLTILLHPTEDRAVGVKLKGFRFIFDRLRSVDERIEAGHFYPLVKALELALVGGMGEALMNDNDKSRLTEKYEQAREIVKDAEFQTRELLDAA